ncbi:GDP-mannose mannosyl hydrolase [Photobacterium alginatilyticum]
MIKNSPLVSIDLVVKNSRGEILLGKRINRPAKGYWFVPGGRILKDESISQAFSRITKIELGVEISLERANFLGPYEHFYTDNFFGDEFSTHYVALGYEVELNLTCEQLPEQQHDHYRWFTLKEILTATDIHKHSKWYV